jgi:uncharacterized protein (TIGR02246 family)
MQEESPARIEAALRAYSVHVLAMDADRIAAAYTPDGELRDPGREPLKGPEAISAFLRSITGVKIEEQEMKGVSLQIVGPSALQTGTFRQRVRLADGKVVDSKGTFEAEWARQPDGSWLISRMTTNPPPLEVPRVGEIP